MNANLKPSSRRQSFSSWHDQSVQALLEALHSTPSGLTESEAQARLSAHGPNRLPEPPRRSAPVRFLLQFHNILIYVLIGSAVITAAMGHVVDTLVIVTVVIANAIIGYIQEGKAESAMDAIRHMLAPHASVMRDGERRSVDGEMLVPGDIVLQARHWAIDLALSSPARWSLHITLAIGVQAMPRRNAGSRAPVASRL